MLFFLPLLCADVYAIPQTLSQQGRLLDNYGTPVEGNHYLTFRIFENTVSTQALFEETLSVNFENGFYMVVLGDSSSNPLDSELFATPPLFLELQLDSEIPFFPRQLLNSIPYSLRTGVAESVEGGSVSASLIEVGGTVVIDSNGSWVGPTMNLNWTDIQGVPQGFADGVDNDTTLSEIEVENMIVNGPLDLAEGTTIGGKFLQEVISCQPGQILQYDGTLGWSCAEDSVLTSDDVLGYVTQNPIDLASGSMINGDGIVTVSTDQVLSESDVEGYITNDVIDLADGSSVNEQDIVTQEAPCSDGQILVYDFSSNNWVCGEDKNTDTQLTADQIVTLLTDRALQLASGTTVDGSPVLTENSSLTWNKISGVPSELADGDDKGIDVSCPEGEILTSTGSGWECAPFNTVLDADSDGYLTWNDCDDNNTALPATDGDCDGILTADDCDDNDENSTQISEDSDCDGVITSEDCNDNNASLSTDCFIGFNACVDDWCLQQGTQDQYTKCESASSNGLICYNPQIRYGTTTGGIPCSHGGNQYGQWCQQLGFSGHTTTSTNTISTSGKLFGCTGYDESNWHWCDWSDGYWLNSSLGSSGSCDRVTSVTCYE